MQAPGEVSGKVCVSTPALHKQKSKAHNVNKRTKSSNYVDQFLRAFS